MVVACSCEETLTTYSYNGQGDLAYFDLPNGSASRVQFDYQRYDQNGVLVSPAVYEGQVTKIRYPNGSQEFFGYDGAGRLAWRRKADGTQVTINYDLLHRASQITYPPIFSLPALTFTYTYDDLGRVGTISDGTTQTVYTYDDLNRSATVTPPSPQKPLSFNYNKDTTNQRWITTVTVGNTGNPLGSYTYQGDSKGRLYRLVNPFGQVFRFEYDKDGKNTLVAFPTGMKEQRTYTGRDWLATLTMRQADNTVL
ncbi:MAG: hypothetical protein C4321_07620, partial [Chloroflexota bacterium]